LVVVDASVDVTFCKQTSKKTKSRVTVIKFSSKALYKPIKSGQHEAFGSQSAEQLQLNE
jgi:hypothetical protein